MKRTKTLLAVVLAIVTVLASALVAFAADKYTITINNDKTGHTYEAYQIFTGVLAEKGGKKILSDIAWGNGISEDGKAALGDAATKAESITDANAFAKEIAKYLVNPVESTPADGKYTIPGLDAGYYLVKDKDNTLDNADDFNTAYIMEVVANVEATPKGDKPSLDKQIKHNETKEWGVVGDNQIGDTVEFRTITTVPDTAEYTEYSYVIHDTMSKGLTSNVKTAENITIKVNDNTVLDAKYYTVTANGNSFDVSVDILAAVKDGVLAKGDSLYTYYDAVLNAEALIYDEGKQSNTAFLEYSNNPYDEGKGKTAEKTVYDWTFKMTVNKIDGTSKETIDGAKFVLSTDDTINVEDLKCDENGVPAATTGLIGLVKVEGGYRVATKEDAAADVVYVIDAGNAVIKGLDDTVTYYLYETKAPEGYNILKAPVSFTITATEYGEDGSKTPTVKATINGAESNTLKADIENKKGTELPSTGGIGTTIFYIAGALLVVLAGVFLITKKRMNKAER